ncbi:tRNA (adenine(58)-N(1))-methyltransferase non-catalytic subunit trm6 [Elasticomyces elasticus]|uniref:tRNA (adenine(58)-N(1))-methyltransferase non-catalytic subunit TRM6 n=1 Tax=Exophiala sideris TaxID=1016849 RepID=A0ABR0JPF4_9EURO|nr:tRNA (adenine(58)-N(1))-methyltransferase non-catalytic subunit trm6 [Elasticomyces elasticus]KAK5038106.1 tRNA (adenine(58)-N(1))-methyltransferase non-catalytic subunit trm6 [Exophiala sideris]KAK5044090.1 tRNA (adenine(58)-N(1))-methyltransferase non-catalytic subunit trm6 [Exophiala sideris]KAK5067590.1 tRNA (adenine(58)-N(1))-methyltransferase non-catalytic subunit trm6 [Exophiala sideris]KAK5184171.1 tRNA (adenine(58)-N(1))-methyltransferase non-catalytic subunit trm6 [Eurotiomycetes s
MPFQTIQPFQYVALRLPSDQTRVEQILPNTLINLGKYGSFRTNQIIGRPYHLTFEILDRSDVQDGRELRIVPAAELHAVTLMETAETEDASTPGGEEATVQPTPKSNVNTYDDPSNQKLTMAEIEALKQSDMGSGKELIEKIMQSHTTLDQKTAFSLAKYTLRKHKKYMKRFCVLPLDVPTLIDWMMADRDFAKVMEMRNEAVGLVGSWANVHAIGQDPTQAGMDLSSRYLVVDDTGGLVVGAMAERMGILHQKEFGENSPNTDDDGEAEAETEQAEAVLPHKPQRQQYKPTAMSAKSNSITLVHANQQPNLGLLRYFNFDSNNPTPSHPLYTNLKTLSWLQLLDPEADTTYQEPEVIPADELAKGKSNRRSAYYRKRRRWERVKNIVDETRQGGFNGLVVTSFTDPVSILRHLVPLVAGGGQVVAYSPIVEPLTKLADYYSTARRTAFINTPEEKRSSEDFPVDPTLLLVPTVQTARVRKWQVLPGRTHPLMTSKGGAEGYIFVGTRVIPAEGKVEARGRPPRGKKNKAETAASTPAPSTPAPPAVDDISPESPLKKQKTAPQNDVLTTLQRAVETEEQESGNVDMKTVT